MRQMQKEASGFARSEEEHGVLGEWAVIDRVIGDAQDHARQNTRGNAREHLEQ